MLTSPQVPELWDERADVLVYLFPRATGRAPSFKIPSLVLASSRQFTYMMYGDRYTNGSERSPTLDGRGTLVAEDATPRSPSLYAPGTPTDTSNSNESVTFFGDLTKEYYHLYVPTSATVVDPNLSPQDVQSLVDIRNLFAFLVGKPLVATRACPSLLKIFLAISALLKKFEFTNFGGSTYGEAAAASFSFFVDDLKLADVRDNREKTVEAIILGEAMRSSELYTEAYTHAIGNYPLVKSVDPGLFGQVSKITRTRLERAYIDLKARQASAHMRLANFEFPSLFSGIAASTSSEESKYVRFKKWKSEYFSMRKRMLSYYKDLHGQWPPKSSSRKNPSVEGGLSRLVLKGLYADMCDLYDLLVDRESLTTRSMGSATNADSDGKTSDNPDILAIDPSSAALRTLLAEFDRASPPVVPPIPFDLPKIPTMTAVDPKYPTLGPKDQHQLSTRKLKRDETARILTQSHNTGDGADSTTPFLKMYKEFEEKESHNRNCLELTDVRYGHWIFLYSVIQSLPLLTMDAPGLQYTDGVEYFLCEPSLRTLPWIEEGPSIENAWYVNKVSGQTVSMPQFAVDHGVEGTFRRSHCWAMAEKWLQSSDLSINIPESGEDQIPPEPLSPLAPPPGFGEGEFGPRPISRAGSADGNLPLRTRGDASDERRSRSRMSQRNSIAFLERLPNPAGFDPSRRVSRTMTPDGARSLVGSRTSSPIGMAIGGEGRRGSSNLSVPPTPRPGTAGGGARTFDEILQDVPQKEPKTDKKKKWSK
jgi:hypothetical protein